jgi:hypothetical protein
MRASFHVNHNERPDKWLRAHDFSIFDLSSFHLSLQNYFLVVWAYYRFMLFARMQEGTGQSPNANINHHRGYRTMEQSEIKKDKGTIYGCYTRVDAFVLTLTIMK